MTVRKIIDINIFKNKIRIFLIDLTEKNLDFNKALEIANRDQSEDDSDEDLGEEQLDYPEEATKLFFELILLYEFASYKKVEDIKIGVNEKAILQFLLFRFFVKKKIKQYKYRSIKKFCARLESIFGKKFHESDVCTALQNISDVKLVKYRPQFSDDKNGNPRVGKFKIKLKKGLKYRKLLASYIGNGGPSQT